MHCPPSSPSTSGNRMNSIVASRTLNAKNRKPKITRVFIIPVQMNFSARNAFDLDAFTDCAANELFEGPRLLHF